MKKLKTYQNDDDDEFLHPFWLGLLMLFTVTIVIGIICLLRKKFGSHIRSLFDRLCCRNKLNHGPRLKPNRYLATIGAYNWTPVYIPPSSISPKFYNLFQNIRMRSLDKDSSIQCTESNEDSIENDVFLIVDESDQVKTPSSQSNMDRDCETARKFYASMRYTSQCQNSSSLETDSNDQPAIRSKKPNPPYGKLNLFRTSRFFQSITNRHDQE